MFGAETKQRSDLDVVFERFAPGPLSLYSPKECTHFSRILVTARVHGNVGVKQMWLFKRRLPYTIPCVRGGDHVLGLHALWRLVRRERVGVESVLHEVLRGCVVPMGFRWCFPHGVVDT